MKIIIIYTLQGIVLNGLYEESHLIQTKIL